MPDCTASLKVAVTGDETAAPVAFHAGEQVVTAGAGPVGARTWAVTVGGGVFTLPGLNRTSTQ